MNYIYRTEDGNELQDESGIALQLELTQCSMIGFNGNHTFESNTQPGVYIDITCTQADYIQLGEPNPTIPSLAGHTHRYSGAGWDYNTPNNQLSDGYYSSYGNRYFVKLPSAERELNSSL